MKRLAIALSCVLVVAVVSACVYMDWANARVVAELRDDPDGERAQRVMLLTLPSGRQLPVNYLRDGDAVFGIRGETLRGHGRSDEDGTEVRADVFARLRPTAPSFTGTLVVVELD